MGIEKIGILFCAKELHECLKHLRPVIGGLENKLPWNPEPLLMVQPQSEPAPSFDAYCLLEYRLPPTHPLAFFFATSTCAFACVPFAQDY